MKVNLSFRDYLQTKNRLKLAGEGAPRAKKMYEATKYCKVPLLEDRDNEDKQYINLKPRDRLEILWEYAIKDDPTPIQVILTFDDDQVMYFSWNDAKVKKWVESSISII